jgi:hypothetical protein
MTLPGPIVCHWCLTLAVGTAYGKAHPSRKATGQVPYCDEHWDNAYETIRQYPERGWRGVEQPATLF